MTGTDLEPARLPWQRQPKETVTSFRYFAHYRDLGMTRTIVTAATDLGKSKSTLEGLSRRFNWVERARAYDDMVDDRMRDERETAMAAAARRESEIAQHGITMGTRRLLGDPDTVPEDERILGIDMNALPAAALPGFLETFIKIRRAADGQPVDVGKGVYQVSSEEYRRAIGAVMSIMLGYIDEGMHARAVMEVRYFFDTGRMIGAT